MFVESGVERDMNRCKKQGTRIDPVVRDTLVSAQFRQQTISRATLSEATLGSTVRRKTVYVNRKTIYVNRFGGNLTWRMPDAPSIVMAPLKGNWARKCGPQYLAGLRKPVR